MLRPLILPGKVQLAVQRFIFITFGAMTVDLGETRANDRVKRRRDHLMLRQEGFHLTYLLRGNVDQKIVRAFRR